MRYVATVVFMFGVIAVGYLHGEKTNRWKPREPLDQFTVRLDAIPKNFDNWTSEEIPILDDLKTHGIEAYIYRNYRSRRSQESYQVLVVCGDALHIAAHTPDVCYRGGGYQTVGEPRRADIPAADEGNKGRSYQLNYMKLRPPATRADQFEKEVRWSWIAPEKTLRVPDVLPRIEFYAEPALYKVYIMSERPMTVASAPGAAALAPSVANQHDPTRFLQAFLPRLEAALKKKTESTP